MLDRLWRQWKILNSGLLLKLLKQSHKYCETTNMAFLSNRLRLSRADGQLIPATNTDFPSLAGTSIDKSVSPAAALAPSSYSLILFPPADRATQAGLMILQQAAKTAIPRVLNNRSAFEDTDLSFLCFWTVELDTPSNMTVWFSDELYRIFYSERSTSKNLWVAFISTFRPHSLWICPEGLTWSVCHLLRFCWVFVVMG